MMSSIKKVEVAEKSNKCHNCKEIKENGLPFCNHCLDSLPTDILHDLRSTEELTKVAAFADATLFLMNDWR